MPERTSDRIVLDIGRGSEVERTSDLVYSRAIGTDLTMDVYRPSLSPGPRAPAAPAGSIETRCAGR